MFGRYIWLLFLLLSILFVSNKGLARAQEDGNPDVDNLMDEEDSDEGIIEDEEEVTAPDDASDFEDGLKESADVETNYIFVKPAVEKLIAGHISQLLVGFSNKGDEELTVVSMEGSFRYPQDFSYVIQNFTTVPYNKIVDAKHDSTFEYFVPVHETFALRSFGLTLLLNYANSEGDLYQSAVFNQTLEIQELVHSMPDGETVLLYLTLAAFAVLGLYGFQKLFSGFGRRHLGKKRSVVERGTTGRDVDMDWIPENVKQISASPKRPVRSSPRLRKSTRNSDENSDN